MSTKFRVTTSTLGYSQTWFTVMLSLAYAAAFAAPPTWDVVVYGSSPAGIAAATAAGMLGLKTALYEPLPMIGGMGAAGFLGLHDGGFGAITGLAYNYTLLNGEYYNKTHSAQQVESFAGACTEPGEQRAR